MRSESHEELQLGVVVCVCIPAWEWRQEDQEVKAFLEQSRGNLADMRYSFLKPEH